MLGFLFSLIGLAATIISLLAIGFALGLILISKALSEVIAGADESDREVLEKYLTKK